MHELYELKDKLMSELEEYGKQDLTAGSLEVVDKLSHSIKNICKIIEAYEMEEEGQSMRGGSYRNSYERGGRGGNRYSYEQGGGMSRTGSSYARGRGSNARRDSMGRYSREDGYSRTDGVGDLVEEIRSMMQELPQNLQMDAQRFVQKLEQEM